MIEYETEAVVLEKKTIGEVDAQIILYTQKLGKLEIIAKGLKKITAKLTSHLESFNLVVVTLIMVNRWHLTSALTLNNFPYLRKNFPALETAYKTLKIFQEAIVSPEEDEILWQELVNFLFDLERFSKEKKDYLFSWRSLYFLIQLAKRLGLFSENLELSPIVLEKSLREILKKFFEKKQFDEKLCLLNYHFDYPKVEAQFRKILTQTF